MARTFLFLFAHQDDEYGVFFEIKKHCVQGEQVFVIYLTDGGKKSAVRCQESVRVLRQLGVEKDRILFPGCTFIWHDGKLHQNFSSCWEWLAKFFNSIPELSAVYVPAWEGGHPDHDTVFAAALTARQYSFGTFPIYQFSLYSMEGVHPPFFRTMHPLPAHGEIIEERIPFWDRLSFIELCLYYPSQWKTWIGLFWTVAFTYLVGKQKLQIAKMPSLQRPHEGQLYYEYRNFCTWEDLYRALKDEYQGTEEGLQYRP